MIKDIQHGHMYIRGGEFGTAQMMIPVHERGLTTVAGGPAKPRKSTVSDSTDEPTSPLFDPTMKVGHPGDWQAIANLRSADDLANVLKDNYIITEAGAAEQLWRCVEHRELVVESKSSEGGLDIRFHGVLLHLEINFQDPETQEMKLLVQKHAKGIPEADGVDVLALAAANLATRKPDRDSSPGEASASGGVRERRGSFAGTVQGRRAGEVCLAEDAAITVDDHTILTILCCHHEPWTNAVMRYCQEVFMLNEEGAKEIVKACQKGKDTCIYESNYAPTICHHHHHAAGEHCTLEYTTLRLNAVLTDISSAAFSPLFETEPVVTRETAFLAGFGGNLTANRGQIEREWVWMTASEAVGMEVNACECPQEKLSLSWGMQRIDGLLLGIEGSAPLKDDCFGNSHSVDAKSKEVSAFGKRKWRDYRRGEEEVPADLGGTTVSITPYKFEYLKTICKAANLTKPSDGYLREGKAAEKQEQERILFQALLAHSDEDMDQIIQEFLSITEGDDSAAQEHQAEARSRMLVDM
jgi:hypothetical protein